MNSLLERLARSASWFMLFGRGLFLSIIILLIVMRSLLTVIRVDGHSMDPNLADGQWVFVDLVSKQFTSWHEGDVAILRFPGDPIHSWYVKRVIGLPGDRITFKDGDVYRNGQKLDQSYFKQPVTTVSGVVDTSSIPVPPNEYIVLGDNRDISNDSRYFGYVPAEDLIGKVLFTP